MWITELTLEGIMNILTDNAKENTWYRKPLNSCVSSNGSPYNITLKKGKANKLLINLVGGGLSWNQETAARPLTISNMIRGKESFYIPSLSSLQLKLMHVGILKAKDSRNPFYDWNIFNIPYTTADFHIGNNEFLYKDTKGESRVMYHNGAKNVEVALATLKGYFDETPDILVIAGQSAGAFGCVAHCPKIISLYPDCKNTIVYSEGSHMHSPLWSNTVKNVWKASPNLQTYVKSNDLIVDLFHYAQDNTPPDILFLHSNSVWDVSLVKYMHKMNHGKMAVNSQALEEFHETLLCVVRKLKSEIANYSYYLTDFGKNKNKATPHIFSGTPKLFYSDMQDDFSIANWLRKAIEKKPIDIGKKFV